MLNLRGMELGLALHAEHGPAVANSLSLPLCLPETSQAFLYNIHRVAMEFLSAC